MQRTVIAPLRQTNASQAADARSDATLRNHQACPTPLQLERDWIPMSPLGGKLPVHLSPTPSGSPADTLPNHGARFAAKRFTAAEGTGSRSTPAPGGHRARVTCPRRAKARGWGRWPGMPHRARQVQASRVKPLACWTSALAGSLISSSTSREVSQNRFAPGASGGAAHGRSRQAEGTPAAPQTATNNRQVTGPRRRPTMQTNQPTVTESLVAALTIAWRDETRTLRRRPVETGRHRPRRTVHRR